MSMDEKAHASSDDERNEVCDQCGEVFSEHSCRPILACIHLPTTPNDHGPLDADSSIREELAAVLREIHLADNSQYRQDADALLASPVIQRIQADAWLKGQAAGSNKGLEPSDAELRAAVNAWHRTEGTDRADWYDNPINRERMRAALRAARGVK